MARPRTKSFAVILLYIAGVATGVGLQREGLIDRYYAMVFTGGAIELTAEEKAAGFVPVVRVVDGDTLVVLRGGVEEKIRMLDINTPERGKPWYDEATESLEELVAEGKVRLAWEKPGQPSRGKYGRLLAYVFDSRGLNVNLEQVARGWAKIYGERGEGRFPNQFADAEDRAKDQRLGIWQE